MLGCRCRRAKSAPRIWAQKRLLVRALAVVGVLGGCGGWHSAEASSLAETMRICSGGEQRFAVHAKGSGFSASERGPRRTLRLRGGSTWGSSWGSSSFGSSKKAHNPENDAEVDAEFCPNDGITCLRFSPKALLPKNYLVATTWEGEVRCYECDPSSGKTSPVSMQRHEKPALCCAWKSDGSAIYSGGTDGKGMMWHLATNSWTQIAQHDGPISGIFYSELPSPCLITCSWDRTVKFWDVSGSPTVIYACCSKSSTRCLIASRSLNPEHRLPPLSLTRIHDVRVKTEPSALNHWTC
jgi:WD40 repeat protein